MRFSPTRSGENFVSPIETLKMEERNSHIDELIAAFLSKGLSKEAREELDAWIASQKKTDVFHAAAGSLVFCRTGGRTYAL